MKLVVLYLDFLCTNILYTKHTASHYISRNSSQEKTMPFKDLREYIARLEREGEVQRIKNEIQPLFEVGAIVSRTYDLRVAAPFFLDLRGYPGSRIFGAPISLSRRKDSCFARFAASMGMPSQSSALEIVEQYLQRLKKPIKPTLIKDGPCKENIIKGEAVDLQIFPAPVLRPGDAGPCLGTWHATITKNPRTGAPNPEWKLHRLMMRDKSSLRASPHPLTNTGAQNETNYEAQDESTEFAIAIGTEPVTPWVAGTCLPSHVTSPDPDIIGGIRGAPLELVQCETVDLTVPATSEIVIEGFILPTERGDSPIYQVTAITHRTDPILPVSCIGAPADDLAVALSLTTAANLIEEVRSSDLAWESAASPAFPGLDNICPPEVRAKVLRNWHVYGYREEGPG